MRLILDIYYPDAGKFSETEHPRGQPENKGEFVKKGSATVNAKPAGSTVKPATPTTGSAKPAPADRKNLFARFESAQKAGKRLNVAEALPSAVKGAWKSGKMATKAAIKSYLEEGYWDVNKVLRQPGSLSTVVEDTPDVLAKIDAIKAAFELPMAKATSDFVTYRGSKLTPKVMDQLKQALASGQPARLRDAAFISTSLRQEFAQHWGYTRLEILVKKGAPALSVSAISPRPHEKEVLLRNGQEFEVLEIKETGSRTRIIRCATV